MIKLKVLSRKLVDWVAEFGGSWYYVSIFFSLLLVWITFNTLTYFKLYHFDSYPFTFLNLILGILASIQAPIVMMAAARQASREKRAANQHHELMQQVVDEIKDLRESVKKNTLE